MIGRRIVIALVVAVAVIGAPSHAAVPEGADYSEAYFTSGDGTTLHADVLRPKGAGKTPVLLRVGPYGGHGEPYFSQGSPISEPPPHYWLQHELRALDRGYTYVSVDLRGFGASDGCWDNGGPGEQADVKAAVEWAASQSWSTGKVGVLGESYQGWTGVMALATRPRGLAAVAALSPVVSGYRSYHTNGVPTWMNVPVATTYPALTAMPGSVYDNADYHGHWLADEAHTACSAQEAEKAQEADPAAAYWRKRDLVERAAQSAVPTFVWQGFLDFQVRGDQVAALYPRLRNPRGLWWGQAAHELPGRAGMIDQVGRFLDAALKGGRSRVEDPAVVMQEAPSLRWRTEPRWPAADAKPFDFPILPGSYRDVRGNVGGDDVYATGVEIAASAPATKGQGSWTFTRPLPHEIHLSGVPRVRASAEAPAGAWLVALLYDLSPDGSALLITRGATVLGDGSVDIELEPQDWRLSKGHRLALLLSGADDSWWLPTPTTGAEVAIKSGSVQVPLLRYVRNRFVTGDPGPRFEQIKRPIQLDQETIERATVRSDLPAAQQRRAGG